MKVTLAVLSGAAFDFAVRTRAADKAGADLVAMAANALAGEGAMPSALSAEVQGEQAVAADIALGVERACRAHAFALRECRHDAGLPARLALQVEGNRLHPLSGPQCEDLVYAVAAPGLQGAGFEFAWQALRRHGELDQVVPELGCSGERALLLPHKVFLGPVHDPLREGCLHAVVPVQGRGLRPCLAAALPAGTGSAVDLSRWQLPGLHAWLMQRTGLALAELADVCTAGVGLLLVVPPLHEARVRAELQGWHEPHACVGRIVAGPGVVIAG
jgi:phosphoribosylformylglycinamidine cyclo-ligase